MTRVAMAMKFGTKEP